jgi:hypothetical protein
MLVGDQSAIASGKVDAAQEGGKVLGQCRQLKPRLIRSDRLQDFGVK